MSDIETQSQLNLTPKERLFVHFYCLTMSLRETAERTNLHISMCREMLKRSHVNDSIYAVLRQNSCMNTTHVEANICKIADLSFEDFYDISDGGMPMLNLSKAKERGVLSNIKRITYDADGRPQPEFWSKDKMLELLAKRHGLVQGDGGAKVDVNINVQAVRETMAAAIADPKRLEAMIDVAERLRLPQGAAPNRDSL